MTSYPGIDFLFFFFSRFFGLAYSGEWGGGQGTRACVCGGWVAGDSGEAPPGRDGDRLATAGLRGLLGITDVSCGDSEDGVSPTVPASGVTFSGDPDWSVEHLECSCFPKRPDGSV